MAHNPAHRRKLGTAESGSSSQKSSKKHTNPSTTSTSTIYNLTNHLSKLNPNTNTNSEYPQKQVKEVSKSVNWESSNANANPNPSLRKLRVGGKMKCYDAESKSYSDAQVELGNFMVTNCAKVVSADMPSFMQIHAVTFARNIKDSLEKFTSNNLALSLKKEFDGVYGPAWHCVVGTSFGSFVTHSVAGFLYFSLDQKLYVLLFKTAVQRAE